ncbi:hypothetical protein CYMTET_13455 [Cymbomonas tetramitiformis]|uniref:Uncharacterized protein n=1 Tax=Cymbomonas tetramitiformis TaxID=36881 RepID=A0AAE0LBE8_9CHLO|nr:hypothetical protein CYMTET_13455 [Cymbomonas tetramitiformis]
MSSAEPRCRVGLVVYAVCRLPLGGAHVAARGCGGTACAMERDETRRHLQAAEARGALLGSALGGGARRVRASEMSGWGARLGGCEMRGMLGRCRDRYLYSNSLTGTVPTELGELTTMYQL